MSEKQSQNQFFGSDSDYFVDISYIAFEENRDSNIEIEEKTMPVLHYKKGIKKSNEITDSICDYIQKNTKFTIKRISQELSIEKAKVRLTIQTLQWMGLVNKINGRGGII